MRGLLVLAFVTLIGACEEEGDSPSELAGEDRPDAKVEWLDAGLTDAAMTDLDSAAPRPCGPGSESFVERLSIRDIALYQTVKVPLVQAGSWDDTRKVPVVQGKAGLIRVFVEPDPTFSPHAVRAVLALDNGIPSPPLEATLIPRVRSSDSDLETTFNFPIAASQIGPDTALRVALIEPVCAPNRVDNPAARFPLDGAQPLKAARIDPLRVMLVPVQLGELTPDTSEAQLRSIEAALLAHYPVPAVQLSTHTPLSWPHEVRADGSGWSDLLNEIRKLRMNDQATKEMYYFGLVAPAKNLAAYCLGSCRFGLAPQTNSVNALDQVGLGVGFADETTSSTIIHELGHAHGRAHAPCAPSGSLVKDADPDYPYADGTIGSWGWDSRTNALMEPALKDMMGYCEPSWVSDYNYAAIADRSRTVNMVSTQKARTLAATRSRTYQGLILYGNGSARWAGMSTREAPAGEVESAHARDSRGRLLETVPVVRVRLDHSSDSFLYLPTPISTWATLELADTTLSLSTIQPAL